MSNTTSARENIFARLHSSSISGASYAPVPEKWVPAAIEDKKERVAKFVQLMTAMRTEVYEVKGDEWVAKLQEIMTERGLKNLVYGQDTEISKKLESAWKGKKDIGPLVPWTADIEAFRDELFEASAGITTTMGGIAEAAAMILWPTPAEPRLLSLVPPVHFAVVKADKIWTSFAEAIEALDWNAKSPTNALLISGPSKTADIELILQFGVHGPTDLIVFVVD